MLLTTTGAEDGAVCSMPPSTAGLAWLGSLATVFLFATTGAEDGACTWCAPQTAGRAICTDSVCMLNYNLIHGAGAEDGAVRGVPCGLQGVRPGDAHLHPLRGRLHAQRRRLRRAGAALLPEHPLLLRKYLI